MEKLDNFFLFPKGGTTTPPLGINDQWSKKKYENRFRDDYIKN